MESALRSVTESFPELRAKLACQFERDEVFRELCEDYAACLEAIERRDPGGDPLGREYAALRLRLENELLRHLGGAAPAGESR
jgi:hypothetical protein